MSDWVDFKAVKGMATMTCVLDHYGIQFQHKNQIYIPCPLWLCDRENRRLCHFDLDGKYVGTVTQHLRRPCQVSFSGDYAVVSELEGRVTVLDRNNVPIAFLGDNPQTTQWANYELDPHDIKADLFSAAHGCFIDSDRNIFVTDWNRTGRVTKLARRRI